MSDTSDELLKLPARNYTDLIGWQRAMDFVEQVYVATGRFPSEERFGLTSQLRREAVSIPSNIAEGQGRYSDREFLRFLGIAHGSLREAETQVRIAERLQYVAPDVAQQLLSSTAEIGRLINGLMNTIERRLNGQSK